MKKLFVLSFTAFVALLAVQTTTADVIADWNFQSAVSTNNIIGAGLTPSSTQSGVLADIGTGTASAFHATAATAWSIPAGNGSANSWSANNWSVGDYYQFSVSTVNYSGITLSYDQTGSNTGPKDYGLAYSLNGSSFTTFGSYSITNDSWSVTVPKSISNHAYDLSAVTTLDNAATVYFRVVDLDTTAINNTTVATTGTGRIDNFIVSATPVPEPSIIALAALGSGACLLGFRRRR